MLFQLLVTSIYSTVYLHKEQVKTEVATMFQQ